MRTESERHLEKALCDAGLALFDLGIDRDEAWAKVFDGERCVLVSASYDANSSDHEVAAVLIQQAVERGCIRRATSRTANISWGRRCDDAGAQRLSYRR